MNGPVAKKLPKAENSTAFTAMPSRIVMRSATTITLNERFTKVAHSRPPDPPAVPPAMAAVNQSSGCHHALCPCLHPSFNGNNNNNNASSQSFYSEQRLQEILEERRYRKNVRDRLGRRSVLREQGQRIRSLLGDRIRSLNEQPRARVIVSRARSRAPHHWRGDGVYIRRGANWSYRGRIERNPWPDRYGYWNEDERPVATTTTSWDNKDFYEYGNNNDSHNQASNAATNGRHKRKRTKYSLDRELSLYMSRAKKRRLNNLAGLGDIEE